MKLGGIGHSPGIIDQDLAVYMDSGADPGIFFVSVVFVRWQH